MKPRLYMIIPCYNEEKVLPITSEMFLEELNLLITKDKISENSRILFVNDGSKDKTWDLIKELSEKDEHFIGICQSRNRGHQNAVLRWNLSRGFSAKHNVSENSVQNICRAVSPQRMRIIGSMVFFYL